MPVTPPPRSRKPLGRPHPDVHNLQRLRDKIKEIRRWYYHNRYVQIACTEAERKLEQIAAGALPRYIKVPYDWRKLLTAQTRGLLPTDLLC